MVVASFPNGGILQSRIPGKRNKESACISSVGKNGPSRKPNHQQRPKLPRARGTFNPSNVGRTEAARLEENQCEAEFGSVFVPGSKKQNITHLIQFNLRNPTDEGRYQSERNAINKTANRLMITRKHKYNKEHFLQANCQFIVNASGDYKQYMNNPDALVDWEFIEQVNVQVSEVPSCPICLYPPVAAKMTRCGHIYCWSCVLHYLSLSDKTWRKCPICYEAVHKSDLKSVVTVPHNTFNVNDKITFKLMKRPRGSLIAYPATATVKDDDMIFNLSEVGSNNAYSKLLVANQSEILSIIQREDDELRAQLLDVGDCPENCFIVEAQTLLEERRNGVLQDLEAPAANRSFISKTRTAEIRQKKNEDCDNVFENSELTDNNNCVTDADDLTDTINPESLDISATNRKFHYFYQASDGQHIYLHAINAKMLEHTYGCLELGPKTLSGKILEKEGGSMTEELRKRLRYLGHLPVTCQFEVAEIQLKPPVVNKDTLKHFHDQIETRHKRRQRRAKEERKREKQIKEVQNRSIGIVPTPELHIESQTQFPCFEPKSRFEPEPSQLSDTSEVSSTPSGSLTNENEYQGLSFAKMLASGRKPALKSLPINPSPSPPLKLIQVTGSKMNCSSFKVRRQSGSEPETENYEPIPSGSRDLGDAIVEALQQVERNDSTTNNSSASKKKKKSKPKVVISNSKQWNYA